MSDSHPSDSGVNATEQPPQDIEHANEPIEEIPRASVEPTEETATSVAVTSATTGPRNAPVTCFYIYAGENRQQFVIDIAELRRESSLFYSHPIITSIELRNEDPAAVRLIENWFNGCIGVAPLNTEARELFRDAARIARDLQITELADQLLIIIRKTDAAFADLLYTQMRTGATSDRDTVIEYVLLELEGYMVRIAIEERWQPWNRVMTDAFDPLFDAYNT